MAFDFYIWYRAASDPAGAEIAVRSMMARLGCRTGVSGRLLKKLEEPGLWMEVYAGVADAAAFERRLLQAVDEFDVEMFLDGPRHSECFIADSPIPAACAAHVSTTP